MYIPIHTEVPPPEIFPEANPGKRLRAIFWVGMVLVLLSTLTLVTQLYWAFNGRAWEIQVERTVSRGRHSPPALVASMSKEFFVPAAIVARVSPGDVVRKSGHSIFLTLNGKSVLCLNRWAGLFLLLGLLLIQCPKWPIPNLDERVNGFLGDEGFYGMLGALLWLGVILGFEVF